MADSYLRNEVLRCLHIGLLCVQENPVDRPTMASIVLMLNSYSITLPSPQNPAYFQTKQSMPLVELESDKSKRKSIPWSINEASITEVYPR